MDDKSTPISSLNNHSNDNDALNQIINKYNPVSSGESELPPINPQIAQMEKKFENRNLNSEMYEHGSNPIYEEHYKDEMQRIQKTKKNVYEKPVEEEYEEYEEYIIEETPLWKVILNQFRIPFFIFIFIVLFFNCTFDRKLIQMIPMLGTAFYECNTYGFLFKTFIVSILSYLFIYFVRFH